MGKGLSLPQEAMKAMKAMKSILKGKPQKSMKATKGEKKKSNPSGKSGNPKAKPATNSPLHKGNLARLGEMSLKERVKQISEEHDDEVSAAMVLKENMSNEEKTRTWNRHNKHLQKVGNEEEKMNSRMHPRETKVS